MRKSCTALASLLLIWASLCGQALATPFTSVAYFENETSFSMILEHGSIESPVGVHILPPFTGQFPFFWDVVVNITERDGFNDRLSIFITAFHRSGDGHEANTQGFEGGGDFDADDFPEGEHNLPFAIGILVPHENHFDQFSGSAVLTTTTFLGSDQIVKYTVTTTGVHVGVPEPSTVLLLFTGLAGLAAIVRKRRQES